MNSILVNFHIPPPLKFKVDTINKYRNVSRTSVINQLLETYVLDQASKMKSSGELNEIIQTLSKQLPLKPKKKSRKKPDWNIFAKKEESYDPPVEPIFHGSEDNFWIDRLTDPKL